MVVVRLTMQGVAGENGTGATWSYPCCWALTLLLHAWLAVDNAREVIAVFVAIPCLRPLYPLRMIRPL